MQPDHTTIAAPSCRVPRSRVCLPIGQTRNYAPRTSGGTSLSSTAWQFPYVQSGLRKHSSHDPSPCLRQRIGGLLQEPTRASSAVVPGCESKSMSNGFLLLLVCLVFFFAIASVPLDCSIDLPNNQSYCPSAFLKPVRSLVSCDNACVLSAIGIKKLPLCEELSGPNVTTRSCFRSLVALRNGPL